jgi:putative IMPACT (imprinted ancient) family translation regulator
VLQKTERLERFILFEYEVEFDFDSMSAMMRILRDVEANVSSAKYQEKNVVTFRVKKQHAEKLEERFKDLYTTKLRFLKMV